MDTAEIKLYNQIWPTFEVVVVGCWVRCCSGEELGPFCYPELAAGHVCVCARACTHACSSFCCISLVCWHTSQMQRGFAKLQPIRSAADHWAVTATIFEASVIVGNALEFCLHLPTELGISSCHRCHHCSSHFPIQLREDNSSQWELLERFGQLMRHPLTESFHPSIYLHVKNYRGVTHADFSCRYVGQLLWTGHCYLPVIFKALIFVMLLSKRFILLLLCVWVLCPCKTSTTNLPCTFISSTWAQCIDDTEHCSHCLRTKFELE